MIWLNEVNGADKVCAEYHQKLLEEFPEEHLTGVIMGSAYGGEVEEIAKLWKDRGTIYGYDVFEELHPKHLAEDKDGFDATCMDHWYQESVHGTEKMAYDYQRKQLDDQGLTNAILVKGEVHPESCKDLKEIHYAFLDMDIPFSMRQGYAAVKDKIKTGGYLFLHDTQNIPGLTEWFKNDVLLKDWDMWKQVEWYDRELLVKLKRK
jgi:hypothetical protein